MVIEEFDNGGWVTKVSVTCVNTNANTTLSEAQGLGLANHLRRESKYVYWYYKSVLCKVGIESMIKPGYSARLFIGDKVGMHTSLHLNRWTWGVP